MEGAPIKQGSLNGTEFLYGAQASSKSMVTLKDFPIFPCALSGLVSYNDHLKRRTVCVL